jgi:hypothetical protein
MLLMTWQEVRALYPDQFVKFEIIESHINDDKEYVDEVAVIKSIKDGREAMKEFIHRKENQFVYSTKNKELTISLIKYVGIRKGLKS